MIAIIRYQVFVCTCRMYIYIYVSYYPYHEVIHNLTAVGALHVYDTIPRFTGHEAKAARTEEPRRKSAR